MTHIRLIAAAGLLAPLLLAGCASNAPRPEAQLAQAEASLVQAEQAGARQYAGSDYDAARDKIGEAHRLADKDKNGEATALAEQARVDAELAAAHSRRVAADKAAAEVRTATETLKTETQRAETNAPAAR